MYVCMCQAVLDSEIEAAFAQGHHNLDALAEELGVGTGCGCCREHAQTLIEDFLTVGAGDNFVNAA